MELAYVRGGLTSDLWPFPCPSIPSPRQVSPFVKVEAIISKSLHVGWWLYGGGIAPPTQEMGCAIVLGCVSGNVCGLLVGFLVVSNIFIKNGCLLGIGWYSFGCVQLPVIEVHQMNTSGSSCHTQMWHGWISCSSWIFSMWFWWQVMFH